MIDRAPLNGCSVLVVDDDYYLAEDSRQALEEAGAAVVGPYGRADEALGSLQEQPPEFVVLDLNLGSGPNFEVARAVKARGLPMILVTGYDRNIIPPDLADTPCLQKPVSRTKLVQAVTELLRR
jgi:DNA-binding response OmpR family regulator